jgi:hypothetical protein
MVGYSHLRTVGIEERSLATYPLRIVGMEEWSVTPFLRTVGMEEWSLATYPPTDRRNGGMVLSHLAPYGS